MTAAALLLTVAASCVTACADPPPGDPPSGEPPSGEPQVLLSYGFADPSALGPEALQKAVDVVSNRLDEADLQGWSVDLLDDGIRVGLHDSADTPLVKDLVGVHGTLEFRVVAPEAVARDILQKREQMDRLFSIDTINHAVEYPGPWYRIVEPAKRAAESAEPREPVVVLIPEAPYESQLEELKNAENPNVPAIRDAQVELARVYKTELFGGADIANADVQQQPIETVVYFEMHPERKDAFTDFTTRNIKRQLAIILDGAVDSAPVIQSALPGVGVISGGGPGGFTRAEADRLAIVLNAGELPSALVLVDEEHVTGD